jgi:periplasmic divalent cation tolerance protein
MERENSMSETIQVMTTTATKDDAQTIARGLVERRLAGCVQIVGPITSVYRWEGDVEEAEEYLCLVKTQRDSYERVEAAIRQMHPYNVPEILAIPVVAGSAAYLSWLGEQVGGAE